MADEQLNLSRGAWSLDLITAEAATGYWLGTNPRIFGAPPAVIDEQLRIATAGSDLTPLTHGPRDLVIPVTIRVADPEDLDDYLEALILGVDPIYSSTPVRVTYTRPDATARYIDAYLIGGGDGIRVFEKDSRVCKVNLGFRAPSPYWTDSSAGTTTIEFADLDTTGVPSWSGTAFEWSDADAGFGFELREAVALIFAGDLPMFPVFEVDGPCDRVALQRQENDTAWHYDAALSASETLTVDTRPGSATVAVNGVNAWSGLQAGSELWTLSETSFVNVHTDGAASGFEVRITTAPQYLQC